MMMIKNKGDIVYCAVQNGVILDTFDKHDDALIRIQEEQRKDFLQIIFKRKLRKLFKKSGDVALHTYSIITVVDEEIIK